MARAFQASAFQHRFAYQTGLVVVPVLGHCIPPRGVRHTAFQRNCFEICAFQISSRGAGEMPRRRYVGKEELERRLNEQRDRGFTRKRWDELNDAWNAQAQAEGKATVSSDELAQAAQDAADVLARIEAQEAAAADIARLTTELRAAAGADNLRSELAHAKVIGDYVASMRAHLAELEDEDEAVMLLLL